MNAAMLGERAVSCGAAKATVITRAQMVLSAEFRDICASNGCGLYGRCWMCPPDIGPIGELMTLVGTFSHGLLYQTIGQLADSFDFEGMSEARRVFSHVSQRIHQEIVPAIQRGCGRALHLACGGCDLCGACAKMTGEPCRRPDDALPPMEGYGFNVSATAASTALKYINGQDTVTYFGIVLFSEG